MKIIKKAGLEEFESQFSVKLTKGSPLTPYLSFRPLDEEAKDKVIWKCRQKGIKYDLLGMEIITLPQEALYKLLPPFWFEEKRCWKGKDEIFLCSEMQHSHLSNVLGYLEILLTLNKISKKNSEDYMAKLQESIIPELEERFKGVILPYEPFYEYEKTLYKEFLEAKKKK